jgi:hypothetical protein
VQGARNLVCNRDATSGKREDHDVVATFVVLEEACKNTAGFSPVRKDPPRIRLPG